MQFKFKKNMLCLMDKKHTYTTAGGFAQKIYLSVYNGIDRTQSMKVFEDIKKILNHENVEKIDGEFFCKDKETQQWIIDHLVAYIVEKKLIVGG